MSLNLNFQKGVSVITGISPMKSKDGISPLSSDKRSPSNKKSSSFSTKKSPKRQKLRSPNNKLSKHSREGSSNFKWSTDCMNLFAKTVYSYNCHLRVQGKNDEVKWTAVGDSLWKEEDFYVQGNQLAWNTLKNAYVKMMKEFVDEFSLGMIK